MRQFWRSPMGLLAALGISSCEVPVDDPAVGARLPLALSAADAAIAAQLYAGAPRTPAGFEADPASPSFAQVTTYHVKTQQLAPAAATQHELCTDGWAQAFAWSEELAAQAPTYLDLVGNDTTDRYFEFDRVPRGQPERYVRMRVFRCGYLDRTGVDLAAPTDFAGALNQRPLHAVALRGLSEYLWLFTSYNNVGHAVLASEARPHSLLAHAITIASLERAATSATCDRVTLREWTHTVNAATGSLQLATTVLRHFGAQRTGGAIVAC